MRIIILNIEAIFKLVVYDIHHLYKMKSCINEMNMLKIHKSNPVLEWLYTWVQVDLKGCICMYRYSKQNR